MKKFLNPKAQVLKLNLTDVICTSQIEQLPDPNAQTGEAPAPSNGTAPDGENTF